VTVATPPFGKIFGDHVRTSLGTRVSNLKSVALTVLSCWHFTPKNLGGHMTVATPPFGKIFGDYVRTVLGNTYVKFEVRSFNRFGAVGI